MATRSNISSFMRVNAPGDTALTVIPYGRPCCASDNVADHTAALAAPYPIPPPPGMRSSSATSETVFTIAAPALRAEMRPGCLRRTDRAHEVHCEHTRELILGDGLDRAPPPAAPPPSDPHCSPRRRSGRTCPPHAPPAEPAPSNWRRRCGRRPLRLRRRGSRPRPSRRPTRSWPRPSSSAPTSHTTTRAPRSASRRACARPIPRPRAGHDGDPTL